MQHQTLQHFVCIQCHFQALCVKSQQMVESTILLGTSSQQLSRLEIALPRICSTRLVQRAHTHTAGPHIQLRMASGCTCTLTTVHAPQTANPQFRSQQPHRSTHTANNSKSRHSNLGKQDVSLIQLML